jgi:hypothetical protein
MHNPTQNHHNQHPQPSHHGLLLLCFQLEMWSVVGMPTAVVAVPAAAVSIAVATATMFLLPIIVDCFLYLLPLLLPPLSSPQTAVDVTIAAITTNAAM